MNTITPAVFLWWWCLWCLWWCGGSGAVVVKSVSPTERNGDEKQETMPLISEEESQLVIRRKLHETAANFERNLKTQLSGVETEIYAEFLSILQALGDTQGNLTQDISNKLRRERAEVLRKVDRVSTYSSILVENLYRDLKKLFTELGIWTEEDPIEASVLYSHQQELQERKDDLDSSSSSSSFGDAYRSKRHMIDWNIDTDERQQNLAKYEPFKEEELEGILASFDHMNSLVGPQDDLDTTLPDWTVPHATTGSPDSPQGEAGTLPRDCLDLLESGMAHDGVYTIYPTDLGVRVWCDMNSLGGGWTVVAGRRVRQPQVNFTRPLLHYQFGFGDPETQHWLGLDHMHALTRATNSTLRVVLHHQALPEPLHATYSAFSVDSREEGHRLTVGGYDPSSTAADGLSPHSGAAFTCPDPRFSGNSCVEEVEAGWWFLEAPLCYLALPTGQLSSSEPGRGVRGTVTWLGLPYVPETLLLMIRRE